MLERVRGRVAVLRLDGEALCDMVVQQALTVEKAGDTARAKTLQVRRRRTSEAPQVMMIRLHTARARLLHPSPHPLTLNTVIPQNPPF